MLLVLSAKALSTDDIRGFIGGIAYISRTAGTSFAFDRPLLTSTLLIFFLGIAGICWETSVSAFPKAFLHKQYAATPLEDRRGRISSRDAHSGLRGNSYAGRTLNHRKKRIVFAALITTMCLRVEVWRHVINGSNCASRSYEVVLLRCQPFVPPS